MSATLVIVVLVLVLGERASDALERKQQAIVLGKLPVPEAHAFYQRLRQRSRRVRIFRALTVAALLTLAYVYRHTANRARVPPSQGAVAARIEARY